MKHTQQLKEASGIQNVHSNHPCSGIGIKGRTGAPIGFLIARQGLSINICEMKFSISDFEITKVMQKNWKLN